MSPGARALPEGPQSADRAMSPMGARLGCTAEDGPGRPAKAVACPLASGPPLPGRPQCRRGALGAKKRHTRAGPPARECPRLALGALSVGHVGVARLAMWRACGPLAGGTPALPGCGPVSDVPGSAGILPATGRRPAKRRQATCPSRPLSRPRRPMPSRSALGARARKAGAPPSRPHPRPRRPMPSRSALGAMSLGARASCPQRAEGPQSADRRTPPSRPPLGALGAEDGPGEARERGCRPLGHVAGL